jgi:cyclic pyranopterin phosphate synthase
MDELIDGFGRKVDYLRISITDRCDFRCVYCMAEEMTFLPREQVLNLEEIYLISEAFTELGVKKIRLTGGEPLVRRGAVELMGKMSQLDGLNELVMTTNGSQLVEKAAELKAAGMKRLNISLDTLNAEKFAQITRTGKLEKVLAGIDAALAQGFEKVKLNAVIMKGRNDHEVLPLVEYARDKGLDLSFIEEMPLGHIDEHDRGESFYSSDDVRKLIEKKYPLISSTESTQGPSIYYRMAGSESRIGFISPHSHNFCGDCNRVRLTAEGLLLLCLGNENAIDLKAIVRAQPNDKQALKNAIVAGMQNKPERHFFDPNEVQIVRFMNMTGG